MTGPDVAAGVTSRDEKFPVFRKFRAVEKSLFHNFFEIKKKEKNEFPLVYGNILLHMLLV